MQKHISTIITIGLLTAAAITAPVRACADEKQPSAEAADTEQKPGRIPFTGKLNAVDKTAKSITLDGKLKKRTIWLTAQTRVTKAGKPASLDDAVIGEEVGGQCMKNAEGKEEAVSLRLGPKPEAQPKTQKTAKEKSDGK